MVKKEWRHEKDDVPPVNDDRVEAVLELLKKQAPLTIKQERFCNRACVERFLIARGDNLKKAAKQLRACLSWRDSLNIDRMIADEFSDELAQGLLYVAGHDDESRPVLIFRMKQQDHQKFCHSLTKLVVALGTMKRNMHQFILLFDASFFRSAPSFMNLFLSTLKIVADFYPGRLFRAFVIDPPSFFPYIWKGVRPFVELSAVTTVLSSSSFREPPPESNKFSDDHGASSFRFNPSPIRSTSKIGSSSSSRFSFTVTNHFDSLKPWYLTFRNASSSFPSGPSLLSPMTARSLSFASPSARAQPPATNSKVFPSTPLPERVSSGVPPHSKPLTPQPSFFRSPASFFRNGRHISNNSKPHQQLFFPHLKLYRKPYNEISYRSMMKPPLGGLASLDSPILNAATYQHPSAFKSRSMMKRTYLYVSIEKWWKQKTDT